MTIEGIKLSPPKRTIHFAGRFSIEGRTVVVETSSAYESTALSNALRIARSRCGLYQVDKE